MPVGPPFGGMTTYTAMLRRSLLFRNRNAVLFDTTPPASNRFGRRLLHAVRNLESLLAMVRKERADVVYFMTSDFMGFYEKSVAAFCCRMIGAKTVLHPVGSLVDFYGAAGVGPRAVIRFLLRRLSAVIVVQHRVQAYVAPLAKRVPVWLIPNPVDTSQLPCGTPERNGREVRILFAGQLVKEKGILDLIEAVRIYRANLRGAVVTVIGDGELLPECRRRIRDHGLEAFVEMRGFVDEPTKKHLLAASHIFCLPSHSEGTPISILEAMGSGLPIVASNVGGIPSVVEHGTHGWLCAPGDVARLGQQLVHLVRNPAVRLFMGQHGQRRVRERFDIGIVAEKLVGRLNALASATHHSRARAARGEPCVL